MLDRLLAGPGFLDAVLDLRLGGTRPDGSPRILVAGSWVIDSRWITSQRIPALGRRVLMACSFSLQSDM